MKARRYHARFASAALAGGSCRARGGRPAAGPGPARRGPARRARSAGAADPRLHGRRRLAGADGQLAAPRRLPALAGRDARERRLLRRRASSGSSRGSSALVARAGPARGRDRPEPRRQHGQGARRAPPRPVCGLVTLGSPQVDPLAVHPLVRLQVEAVSRLGSLGAPGLFKRSCLDGDCCADFWEHLAAPLPRGVGLRLRLLAQRRHRRLARLPRPGADEQVEIGTSHCGMAVSPAAWRAVAKALERFRRAEARRRPAKAQKAQRVRKLRRVA